MINSMKFRIFGMYVINLLVVASIHVCNNQNIATNVLKSFSDGFQLPNLWIAIIVLILYFIVNSGLDKNVINVHFNRLKVLMLILILLSFITEHIM